MYLYQNFKTKNKNKQFLKLLFFYIRSLKYRLKNKVLFLNYLINLTIKSIIINPIIRANELCYESKLFGNTLQMSPTLIVKFSKRTLVCFKLNIW